jgi:hypothetical protein
VFSEFAFRVAARSIKMFTRLNALYVWVNEDRVTHLATSPATERSAPRVRTSAVFATAGPAISGVMGSARMTSPNLCSPYSSGVEA